MFIKSLTLVFALCTALPPTAAKATCADLALVLAIDSSSSIDPAEFSMQLTGYSAAFADPGVQHALAETGIVDVAAVFWADAAYGHQIVPWQRIQSPHSAEAFAAHLLASQRRISGDTDIGAGLMAAIDLLDHPNNCALRKIINVSGDGPASPITRRLLAIPLPKARARAQTLGITVNGLAIINANATLVDYYQTQLITGPGAFVMSVADFQNFSPAIIAKLQREISLPVSASLE